mgnify:CR=1 FL=1
MKLNKYYSIDECRNEDFLYESLEKLKSDGKIDYSSPERWVIKIVDLDLTTLEEKELIKLLESNDVYSTDMGDEYDDDVDDFDDFADDIDDKPSRKSKYDDDYDF